MPNPAEILRKNVEKILADRGWSQNRLSKESGIKQGQISEWLTGTRSPSLESLAKLAEKLDVPVEALLREGEPIKIITREPTTEEILDYLSEAMRAYKIVGGSFFYRPGSDAKPGIYTYRNPLEDGSTSGNIRYKSSPKKKTK